MWPASWGSKTGWADFWPPQNSLFGRVWKHIFHHHCFMAIGSCSLQKKRCFWTWQWCSTQYPGGPWGCESGKWPWNILSISPLCLGRTLFTIQLKHSIVHQYRSVCFICTDLKNIPWITMISHRSPLNPIEFHYLHICDVHFPRWKHESSGRISAD